MSTRKTSVIGVRLTAEERARFTSLIEQLSTADLDLIAEVNEGGRPPHQRGGGNSTALSLVTRRALLLGLKVMEDERA